MNSEPSTIEIDRTIRAGPPQVFARLTQPGHLWEWLCDRAQAEAQPGGSYTLRWRSGYQVQGTFLELEPPKRVTMLWQGIGQPAPTLVRWELRETAGRTAIRLLHSGFGGGPYWETAHAEAKERWEAALDNLQSLLEDGEDLRELREPDLGVLTEGMDAGRAERDGIATETGFYVRGLVPGGPAEAAGLRHGDVIVALGGREMKDWSDYVSTIRSFHAGDVVEVGLVRGQGRSTVPVQLAATRLRPVPEGPAQAAALLRQQRAAYNAALAEVTAGLTDGEASRRPAPGEWSVQEILVHLILCEWMMLELMAHIATGTPTEHAGMAAVWPDMNTALLAAEPTLAGMLGRFARVQEDACLLVEHLSEATRADKYRYRKIMRTPFDWGELHVEDHIGQVQRTSAAVRGSRGESP